MIDLRQFGVAPRAGRETWARVRERPSALAASAALALVVVLCVLAPLFSSHAPAEVLAPAFIRRPPSIAHPFGTDGLGRDLLARVLFGGRVSLAVAAVATIVAALVGTTVGSIAGFAGGRVDAYLMRAVDALLALPRILVLIALFAFWPGVPLPALILLIGATAWFPLARLVRAQVRELATREHVAAARALGASATRVLVRHVMPHVAGTVLVVSTLLAGEVITIEAGLSFLGVGVQPPNPSWGNLIRDARDFSFTDWWMVLFPGLAIAVTVVAVNHLADVLRDAVDPRQLPQR